MHLIKEIYLIKRNFLNFFSIALSPMATSLHQVSPDEILIDFLIENPCLWDKSDHDFRNRNLKDFKWKEVASRMNMAGKFTKK